jgi:hypothetical protein
VDPYLQGMKGETFPINLYNQFFTSEDIKVLAMRIEGRIAKNGLFYG